MGKRSIYDPDGKNSLELSSWDEHVDDLEREKQKNLPK